MIKIKGINNNLVFVFGRGSFNDYIEFLQNKFSANPDLFRGSRVIFKGEGLENLSHDEIHALQRVCLDFGMILNNFDSRLHKSTSKDIFVYKNVRSGQTIRSEGSVIIWGDVHESAEIMAARDIIVLGKLEGIAHAGFYGDYSSIVFALSLAPGQIRIGDILSRCPADYEKKNSPEIAYLENDTICIKEYKSQDLIR